MSARHWVEMYRTSEWARGHRWRWRFRVSNGRILADSGQSYRHRLDCLRGAQRVCGYDVEIREVES